MKRSISGREAICCAEGLEPRVLLAAPIIGAVGAPPDPVVRGESATLAAQDVTGGDGGVRGVQFWRDVNGDGAIGAGDVLLGWGTRGAGAAAGTWTLKTATAALPVGACTVLARAYDTRNQAGPAAAGGFTVRAGPVIGALAARPTKVTAGNPVSLIASGVYDLDGRVARIEFYYDRDGSGVPNPADKLGEDSSSAGGWSAQVVMPEVLLPGASSVTLLARATDDRGAVSHAKALSIGVNARPTAAELGVSASVVPRGDPVTLSVTGVADPDQGITRVEFYRDADGDGKAEPGTDPLLGAGLPRGGGVWSLTLATGRLPLGDSVLLAVAKDGWGTCSQPAHATLTVTDHLPLVTALTVSGPVTASHPMVLAATAWDPDGRVSGLTFAYDANANGQIDAGEELPAPTRGGASSWQLRTLAPADLPTSGGAAGFLVQVTDEAGSTTTAGRTVVVNALPQVGALVGPATAVQRGNLVTLSASNVTDGDGRVARVAFYRDQNDNGSIDPTDPCLGCGVPNGHGDFTRTLPATAMPVGTSTILVRATDNLGCCGAPASATVVITGRGPRATALVATPRAPAANNPVTLTVAGASALDGPITKVEFYFDRNQDGVADPSEKLGEDTTAAGGWRLTVTNPADLPAGETVRYLARLTDSNGDSTTVPAGAQHAASPPVIGAFAAPATPVLGGSTVTLTAGQVTDADGAIAYVAFYRDADGNGQVGATDPLLGYGKSDGKGNYTLTVPATVLPWGASTVLVRAAGRLGDLGSPVATTVTVIPRPPEAASLAVTPAVLAPNNPLTLSVVGVAAPDGSIVKAEFYLDPMGSGVVDPNGKLGEDTSAVGGWTLSTSAPRTLPTTRPMSFVAVLTDHNGNRTTVRSPAVVTVAAPVIETLTVTQVPVPAGPLTLRATGVSGAGGVSRMEFWLDRDRDNRIGAADRFLGYGIRDPITPTTWILKLAAGSVSSGRATFLARAFDANDHQSADAAIESSIE